MTRKRKRALLKKGAQILEPVLREEAALIPAAGRKLSKKAAENVVQAIPVDKIKKAVLLAGGALLGLSVAGGAAKAEATRLAVSRELKRQLKPVHEKLDALEKENEELRTELRKKAR